MCNFLSIRQRIVALCAIPLAVLLLVQSNTLLSLRSDAEAAREIAAIAELAPTISALVHELQKERGQSAGFIGSKGNSFSDTLPQQRELTDDARQRFEAEIGTDRARSISTGFAEKLETANARLAELADKRGSVDGLSISVGDMAGFYTPLIADLLGMVEAMRAIPENANVLRPIIAYTAILQGKERAGIERAMGANGFGAGAFKPPVFRRFVRLGAMQDTYFSEFRKNADADLIAVMKERLSGLDDYDRLVALAKDAPFGADISGVTGPQWFGVSTDRINRLKEVEDRVAETVLATAARHAAGQASWFWTNVAFTVSAVFVTAILAAMIIRSIIPPLNTVTQRINALARGDGDFDIEETRRGDEIGEIARALVVFRDNARAHSALEAEAGRTRDAEVRRQETIDGLIKAFQRDATVLTDRVAEHAAEVEALVVSMLQNAEETISQSRSSTRSAEETSGNVQTVASATEELSSSVHEISRQITQTSEMVEKATSAAADADLKISDLDHASQQIGEVVSLIQDIAEQTNLLALNATIEAARAGEMGKGFAVVASEVKTLANQTGKATEDIAQQITGIQSSTNHAVAAIKGISAEMDSVNKYTSAIAAAIEEQGAATAEISRNVQQASAGIRDVADNMVAVNGAVDETRLSSTKVREASALVHEDTKQLHEQIEKFLASVAAA